MNTFSENITYRQYEDKDLPAILNLWKDESGWGGITSEQFNDWFMSTPYGRSIIVVAENAEAEVVGQIVYAPSRMIVDGKEIKALRGAAPILSKEMRGENIRALDHPALGMIRRGFQIAENAGYQFIYTFPAYGWLGLLRLFPKILPNPVETASFGCFAISLEDVTTFQDHGAGVKALLRTSFTEEYDDLWNEGVKQMPVRCAVVRKANWLRWALGGMHVIEVRKVSTDQLIGYAALKRESGLVVDVFARTLSDLETVYHHCVYALHHLNPNRLPLPYTTIKGMITKQNERVLNRIGFAKDDFRFAFGGYLLDTTIPCEKVQTSEWYMNLLA